VARVWTLPLLLLAVGGPGCESSATGRGEARTADASAPRTSEVPAARLSTAAPVHGTRSPASAPPSAPTHAEPPSGLRLRRAAALAQGRVVAISADGVIYRLAEDHWARVPLVGAEGTDVVAALGALWVLARGTGENSGTAVVLRTTDGVELTTAATASLGPESAPAALAVAQPREFYIGGESPALVRLLGTDMAPVPVGGTSVAALRLLHNDLVVALHGGTRLTVTRWGEGSSADVEGLVDVLAEPAGRGTTVVGRGVFEHGRPGRITGPWTTEAPFVPAVAAVLADGRPVVAGRGGAFAAWAGNAWHVLAGPFPRDPVAVLPSDPPLVLGATGALVALVDGEVRQLVPADAPAR
jgi:hypothetical protein